MLFFNSHAGKAVGFIAAATLLLAWPPALPWLTAVALLQLGVKHFALAFREIEHDVPVHPSLPVDDLALPAPGDAERSLAVAGSGAVSTRS